MRKLSVAQSKQILEDGDQRAFIDVRETAEYNLAHIAGFGSLPRRLIEFRMAELVPYQGTEVVVCDDDGRRAELAAKTLEALGYRDVSVLVGGLNRWVTEGLPTEWGVNVPSKDFGEKLLLEQQVPEVEPDELHEWLARGDKLLILDSRTPEEHERACIPGSRSLPGGELALRAPQLINDADTRVVVHCAGRTRSILGAATLRRLGLDNVFALKNGTMGWQLAGFELEMGSKRLDLPGVSAQASETAANTIRSLAKADGVVFIDIPSFQSLTARAGQENVYLIDVRAKDEYEQGHIPGFRWVPGGQAVQQTDTYVGVRGGAIVFACDGSARASMTASWFCQMGFPNVSVLDGGSSAWQRAGLKLSTGDGTETAPIVDGALRQARTVAPRILHEELQAEAPLAVLHVGMSDEFALGHVAHARWLPRSWLELRITEAVPDLAMQIVVTCQDGASSALAAATLLEMGYKQVRTLDGGIKAWRNAGLPVESGLAGVGAAPDDVLPARRSYAEMMNYLRWEEELGEKYRR